MRLLLLICFSSSLFCKAQNVGIGTQTPQKNLHIIDSFNHVNVMIESPTTSLDKDVTLELKQAIGSTDWLRIKKYSLLSSETIGGVSLSGSATIFSGFDGGDLKIGTLRSTGQIDFFAGGQRQMVINPLGNIGIGTATPVTPLHIISSGYEALRIQGPTASATFYNNAASKGYIQAWTDGLGISSSAGNNLRLYSNQGSNERITILSNGNVGINNNNPAANLHINSTVTEAIRVQGINPAQTFYNNTNYIGFLQAYGTVMALASQGTNRVGLFSNGTERLSVLPNGNIGINNISPNTSLDVNGFTRLGSEVEGAPKIKTKLVTGILPPNGTQATYIPILFPSSKVISVNARYEVQDTNGDLYYYDFPDNTALAVTVAGVNYLLVYSYSSSMYSKQFKAFITYIE